MCEQFIVDWQEPEESRSTGSVVSISMRGRKAGLYRVKENLQQGILLCHGAISFPVGTRLDIEGYQEIGPGARHSGRVVANDQHGFSLAW